nr:MAG TPA: hypothetical protein [Caudoviricetes sp.]
MMITRLSLHGSGQSKGYNFQSSSYIAEIINRSSSRAR